MDARSYHTGPFHNTTKLSRGERRASRKNRIIMHNFRSSDQPWNDRSKKTAPHASAKIVDKHQSRIRLHYSFDQYPDLIVCQVVSKKRASDNITRRNRLVKNIQASSFEGNSCPGCGKLRLLQGNCAHITRDELNPDSFRIRFLKNGDRDISTSRSDIDNTHRGFDRVRVITDRRVEHPGCEAQSINPSQSQECSSMQRHVELRIVHHLVAAVSHDPGAFQSEWFMGCATDAL